MAEAPHFIEKKRTAIGQLNSTAALRMRAGERPFVSVLDPAQREKLAQKIEQGPARRR